MSKQSNEEIIERIEKAVNDRDLLQKVPTKFKGQPIDVWVEETPGVPKLLNDFVAHSYNTLCGNMAPNEVVDVYEFKRMCAISLRQFLEQ